MVADDPKRDGTDRRSKDAGSAPDQDLGRHYGPERWREGNQYSACGQRDDCTGDQRALRMQAVDQSTSRGLGQNSGNSANSESDSDALLVPAISRQVNCEERADPRLDVGEEEIQPVQSAQRARGRRVSPGSHRRFMVTLKPGPA